MKRVAALWLPHWSIERIVRAEPTLAPPPPDPGDARIAAAPRSRGWRPGARWARDEAVMPRLRSDDGAPRGTLATIAGESSAAPLVTQHKVGSRVLVAAASPAALALGIEPGMALTQARACVPGLVIRAADPAGDHAELVALATLLARRWTPVVALSDADGLVLDLTGAAHLHGGEQVMARRLVRRLARSGFTARVAIAHSAGAAWGLARHGFGGGIARAGWLSVTGDDERLLRLPVAALRLDPAGEHLLQRFGVATVADLLALPRGPLVRRFGATIATRLDQLTGVADEPLAPIVPPDRIVVEQRFVEPIATADAIEHWLGRLVSRLVAALAGAGRGARALGFVATRVDGSRQAIRIGCARPTRDPAHLLLLLARRIETIDPGFGIDALALHVLRADPLGPEPFGAALAEEIKPDLALLVDTLANRIGARRLWRMRPVESDVPERSVARIAPLDPPSRDALPLQRDDVRRLAAQPPVDPWHPRWPRPVRLLARPEPLENVLAELPDRAPARFTWRGVHHQVIRADGPERIAGEWWRRAAERDAVRDYFQIENAAGHRFWLFRRGDGERPVTGDLSWYMHGAFG